MASFGSISALHMIHNVLIRDEDDVAEDEACRALLMVRGGSGEDGTWYSTWLRDPKLDLLTP